MNPHTFDPDSTSQLVRFEKERAFHEGLLRQLAREARNDSAQTRHSTWMSALFRSITSRLHLDSRRAATQEAPAAPCVDC